MSGKKIITVFGATGNQGGSVIDIVLARPELSAKYALRGITRDTESAKSKALAAKGVELVQGELDNLESLKTAIKGSYGVFGVTDFWSILDMEREIQQGKNIFEASKAEGVKHIVFSSLPHVIKLTNGELKNVKHFDGKAVVGEYIEANKGSMMASFFQPAMFINFAKQQINKVDGVPTIAMPISSDTAPWPLIDPRRDGGKYVLGLFEAGQEANGAIVHGVSTWTTPKEVVAALSKETGKEVVFKSIPAPVFKGFLPPHIADELVETILLVGNYSYYGKGAEKEQAKHDKFLLEDADLISYPQWVHENAPWTNV